MKTCSLHAACSGDIKAVVCEPLTPHQHFFMMPHDYQYMLTLARSLDALKVCMALTHAVSA
jgi:hypothetical protein